MGQTTPIIGQLTQMFIPTFRGSISNEENIWLGVGLLVLLVRLLQLLVPLFVQEFTTGNVEITMQWPEIR